MLKSHWEREGVYTLVATNVNGKTNDSISVRFDRHQTKLLRKTNYKPLSTFFIPDFPKPAVYNKNTLTLIVYKDHFLVLNNNLFIFIEIKFEF